MSDAAVAAKTGKTWRGWVSALNRLGAGTLDHRAIAVMVGEKFGLSPWWRQTVTVGYERMTGRRSTHQTTGGYNASVSRTLPHSTGSVHAVLNDASLRRRILGRAVVFSTNRPGKVVRFAWGRNGEQVIIAMTAKSRGKCQVNVQHERMAKRSDVAKMKAHWSAALNRLERLIAP